MDTEFGFVLSLENTEEAALRLQNDVDENGNVIPQRELTTGYDRPGNAALMAVNGSMPIVVHGTTSASSSDPHTLVVFDWHIACRIPGKRFREVHIEVEFTAHADRGDAEHRAAQHRAQGGRRSFWDPSVVNLSPMGTSWYHKTPHVVGSTHGFELGVTAGFSPFVSGGPNYSWTKTDSGAERIDAIKVVGDKHFGEGLRSQANGARWDLVENEATESGVPSYIRTAVLLKRQPRDNGQFLGKVKVRTSVSGLHDLKEAWRKVTGTVPKDDPIVFDPQCSDRPGDCEDYRDRLDEADLEGMSKVMTIADGQGS
ncbi:uncharacterized protein NECHADRAFT_77385 [Fusarium vanettenii 77-13-4]|uniref:Uncharacterized protein n=1 Tax=Fusarium vanettenii (strain ATCC MYA-4622 / CBS 123669 / FGSC 9596 / NRRL 45880 / 77-13-4) TaxID=660122 RepID=C7YL32_FUSV7|nr:uncharacterized protein NECHADRAFT_77385 [Fusarium vanettenii 77-13-4]EEU47183.1 hypothetical protein NECHADRAFT_77385 [Fusarium vanettenii 77-13-4]